MPETSQLSRPFPTFVSGPLFQRPQYGSPRATQDRTLWKVIQQKEAGTDPDERAPGQCRGSLLACRCEKSQQPFCTLVNGEGVFFLLLLFFFSPESRLPVHTLRLKLKQGGAHSERCRKRDQLPHFLCQCKPWAAISESENTRRVTGGYRLISS